MTTFIGRYRILDLLGVGGMGMVYRAEDLTLRRPVALKFLAPALASDEEYRARFLREARVAASLNHPNTCVVYEVGEVDESVDLAHAEVPGPGTPFIAMELIEGETLATRLASAGPLAIRDAVDIALQIAEGLAEAHSRRIVHRDLKPHNVMITPRGHVKIVDFGLAKPIRSLPGGKALVSTSEMISADMGEGVVVGTCAYMSPEQAASKPLDARSDVFAFGIMLYRMIAGRLPFHGDTATETLAKILEAEPPPLPPAAAGASKAFEQVVWRCLRKKPNDRYADACALRADLHEIALSLSGDSRTFPAWRRVRGRIGGAIAPQGRRRVALTALLLAFIAAYPVVRKIDIGREDVGAADSVVSHVPPAAASETGGARMRLQPLDVPSSAAHGQIDPPRVEPHVTLPNRSDKTPVSANRPSPSVGTLTVTSLPRSSVSLDGHLTGITPLTLETGVGMHEVILAGPDGLRWRGRVDVTAGETSSLHSDLNATGSLSVVSDIWAEVSLDEGPPEQTPIHFPRLATGLHSLRASREGHVTQVLEIFIEEGRASSLRITLDKKP